METNPFVFVLVVFFGAGSWIGTSSIWMEMPIFTQLLPESWTLPSQLILVIQVSCIGIILYTILLKCLKLDLPHAPIIQSLLVFGACCYVPLAFLWPTTANIFGAERSWLLIVCTFGLGLVCLMSDLVFMPFMDYFSTKYLTAYFIGMGLSGLLPSVVAIVQGTGKEECVLDPTKGVYAVVSSPPRFSPTVFYLIMCGSMTISAISFFLLSRLRKRYGKDAENSGGSEDSATPLDTEVVSTKPQRAGRARYAILLASVGMVGAFNNVVVPSLLSYASLPYSDTTYSWAQNLGFVSQTAGGFLAFAIIPTSLKTLLSLVAVMTAFTGYIVALAAASPDPWLKDSLVGSILAVVCAVGALGSCTFMRSVLTAVIRDDDPTNPSRLFWCGFCTQVGSFIGTAVIFPLVNVFGARTSSSSYSRLSLEELLTNREVPLQSEDLKALLAELRHQRKHLKGTELKEANDELQVLTRERERLRAQNDRKQRAVEEARNAPQELLDDTRKWIKLWEGDYGKRTLNAQTSQLSENALLVAQLSQAVEDYRTSIWRIRRSIAAWQEETVRMREAHMAEVQRAQTDIRELRQRLVASEKLTAASASSTAQLSQKCERLEHELREKRTSVREVAENVNEFERQLVILKRSLNQMPTR
ncbi:hypothetical protein AAVH_05633 [Aphelenchoides avenae]|nr:hypothetical protein AAVH_05633 [Aphelenchus avenae]